MLVPRKTIILFSVLVFIAIVVVIFAYLYRYYVDNLVADYVAKITTCENITDENVCYNYDFCAGVYLPGCEDCNDYEFGKCVRVPESIAQRITQEKKLCQETKGSWFRDRMGFGCSCPNGIIFDKIQGCVLIQ